MIFQVKKPAGLRPKDRMNFPILINYVDKTAKAVNEVIKELGKMDKEIKKGFQKVEKVAKKEEKSLVKKDIKHDKACDKAKMMAKKRKK